MAAPRSPCPRRRASIRDRGDRLARRHAARRPGREHHRAVARRFRSREARPGSPTSCGAWPACTSTRWADAAAPARCTCAAPILTTRWCWSTACASTIPPMRAAARSISPPSTSPTSSAWKSRAARIRRCTAVMRSRAWSTSSRGARRASAPRDISMPWAARTTRAKSSLECRRPARATATGTSAPATATRARWCAATTSTRNASRAAWTRSSAPPPRCSPPGVIPRSSRAGFPDDSGGYEFADIRETEKRDADEAVFGTGLTTRVGDVDFLAAPRDISSATITSTRPASRRVSAIPSACRPAWSTPISRAYSATLTGTQKVSDMLSVAYGVDWLREEGTQRRHAGFRRRLRAADLVRADAHFVGAFHGGAGRFAHGALGPGRRAFRQARRHGFGHQSASARWPTSSATAASRWPAPGARPSNYPACTRSGHPLVGNPDLAPERGESQEIELSQTAAQRQGALERHLVRW